MNVDKVDKTPKRLMSSVLRYAHSADDGDGPLDTLLSDVIAIAYDVRTEHDERSATQARDVTYCSDKEYFGAATRTQLVQHLKAVWKVEGVEEQGAHAKEALRIVLNELQPDTMSRVDPGQFDKLLTQSVEYALRLREWQLAQLPPPNHYSCGTFEDVRARGRRKDRLDTAQNNLTGTVYNITESLVIEQTPSAAEAIKQHDWWRTAISCRRFVLAAALLVALGGVYDHRHGDLVSSLVEPPLVASLLPPVLGALQAVLVWQYVVLYLWIAHVLRNDSATVLKAVTFAYKHVTLVVAVIVVYLAVPSVSAVVSPRLCVGQFIDDHVHYVFGSHLPTKLRAAISLLALAD
mmetsp:Transcript_34059/g.83495  ORF Transcript_34059/g.83495 Transcript_34059/m.83495 type:complete len:349 (+) Transcript_34059:2-1048(+)